jgi:hypothetical protein
MSEGNKKVTVELANKATGEREKIVTLDNRIIVSRVVALFAQRQKISTDQVDVHLSPAQHNVAL